MTDIEKLLEMLTAGNPKKRYEACELLRVAPFIPEKAIAALREATSDPNADVVDAATRAIAVHTAGPRNAQLPAAALSVRTDPLAICALALALIGAPYWLSCASAAFASLGDIPSMSLAFVGGPELALILIASVAELAALVLGFVSLARIDKQTPRLGGRGYAWAAIALAAPGTIGMIGLWSLLLGAPL